MAFSLFSFAATLSICYGIFYIVRWHFRRRRLYELASKFQGPRTLPIIGNAHQFVGNTEHVFRTLDKLMKTYPSPFRVWLGSHLYVVIHDPKNAKVLLQNPKAFQKSTAVIDYIRPFLGAGLFSAPASVWKVHRKLIQPTFNPKILDSFVDIFSAQSKTLVERMERNVNGPEFDIFEMLSLATLEMVCETALGVKLRAQMDSNCIYVNAINQVTSSMCKRFFNPWRHPDLIFRLTQMGRDQIKNIKFLHNFTDNVIHMKKKELLERNDQSGTADNEDESMSHKEAFLDYFMKLSGTNAGLSDEQLRDEVHTMILAGTETSASTISFAMMTLAFYPDIQEKVYEELYEIYGNNDIEMRPVKVEDLPHMKYLERVIKETLRLFSIASFTIREATDELEIDGYTIPKGCSIAVAIIGIHRNEEHWPDPLKFDPDRFLPEEVAKRHPYAFLGFGGGPRNCIGQTYALMSMKTLMATILRKFILKTDQVCPVAQIRLRMELLVRPVNPCTVKLEYRPRN